MSRRLSSRVSAYFLFACGLAWSSMPLARGVGYEALSPNEATRIGMVSSWQQQMSVTGGAAAIVDARIIVDDSRKKKFVEVTVNGKNLLRIAENQLNAFGQPIGLTEARRLAQLEVYKLKRRSIEGTISEVETPEIRLYVLTKDGTIEARNAETGQVLWNERFGNEQLPSLPMALNTSYVAFVNGAQLILIDALSGKLLHTMDYDAVPLQGPVIAGHHLFAVCTARKVEGYDLKNMDKQPFTTRVAGLPMARPVSAPNSSRMMWPTSAGFVYALDGEGRPGLVFRFAADGLVSAQMAFGSDNQFFAATDKGQVYGMSANGSGRIQWRYSLGDPIYDSPHLIGERVYFKTVYGELHCLNAKTGEPLWNNPVRQVAEVLGGIESQLLVRTISGTIRVIDSASGTTLVDFHNGGSVTAINNPLTNRIYLITSSGSIQCLRPADSDLPKMLLANLGSPEADQDAGKPADSSTEPPFGFGAETGDEMGTETIDSDPFGGDAGDGVDPFGGDTSGDDPFGG
jgi:outer membrane protein assembly factor BamB